MGHAQVAFDFMRISIPAPPVPAIVAVAEGSASDQVDASDVENGGGAGRNVGQRGSGDTRQQRRGWRGRGNNRGESGQRRNDGKARTQT